MQYAVTSTQLGKITLEVDQDESSEDRLTFRILDTGEGVSIHEMDNLHFRLSTRPKTIAMARRTRWHSG